MKLVNARGFELVSYQPTPFSMGRWMPKDDIRGVFDFGPQMIDSTMAREEFMESAGAHEFEGSVTGMGCFDQDWPEIAFEVDDDFNNLENGRSWLLTIVVDGHSQPSQCPVCGGKVGTAPLEGIGGHIPANVGEIHWYCESCGLGGPANAS